MITEAVLSTHRRRAILDAEARALGGVCARYGVLTRHQLAELAGARRWTRGRYADALAAAIDAGLIRELGLGFYAPPRLGTKPDQVPRPLPSSLGGQT